jgi:hypothetical protein
MAPLPLRPREYHLFHTQKDLYFGTEVVAYNLTTASVHKRMPKIYLKLDVSIQ